MTTPTDQRQAARSTTVDAASLETRSVTFRYEPELPRAQGLKGAAARLRGRAPTARAGGPSPAVLDEVSVRVAKGEFLALVGPSGCGKTTLLNLFAGLLTPTEGEIHVNGHAPRLGSADTAYMFARDSLLPWRSCRRNVELSLEDQPGGSKESRRRRSTELLDYVGLSDVAERYPRQLSQGMRQRVALARTMAPAPDILLMDEPFAALDAQTKLRLQAEFLRIWESGGADRATVLFVTHDLQESLLLADRVIVMHPRPGRIAHDHVIDLPRPRGEQLAEMMFEETFRTLHHQLFRELSEASR